MEAATLSLGAGSNGGTVGGSLTVGNPIAEAVVLRASGLAQLGADGRGRGRDDLVAAASSLRSLGARYQWARTLVMLGGDDRERGLAELQQGAAVVGLFAQQALEHGGITAPDGHTVWVDQVVVKNTDVH